MKLADNKFSSFNGMVKLAGVVIQARYYVYESGKKLYDVVVINGIAFYRVNLKDSKKNSYHSAIESKYNLQVEALRGATK